MLSLFSSFFLECFSNIVLTFSFYLFKKYPQTIHILLLISAEILYFELAILIDIFKIFANLVYIIWKFKEKKANVIKLHW